MLPLIAERRSEIADICRRFGVSRFGPAARGEDFARSDVDFPAYEPAANAGLGDDFALRDELAAVGRPVDLSSRAALAQSVRLRRRRAVSRDGLHDPRAYLWDGGEGADAIASFVPRADVRGLLRGHDAAFGGRAAVHRESAAAAQRGRTRSRA